MPTRFVAAVVTCVLLAPHGGLDAQPQSPPASRDGAAELARVDQLERLLTAQQAQVDQLRKLLAAQQEQIGDLRKVVAAHPQPLAATASGPDVASTPNTAAPGRQEVGADAGRPAPLRLRIGTVDITPSGFMDFTSVSRDANMASGIATNFGAVPFSNTVNGHLHEHQFGAQNSRLSLRFDTKVKAATLLA